MATKKSKASEEKTVPVEKVQEIAEQARLAGQLTTRHGHPQNHAQSRCRSHCRRYTIRHRLPETAS